MYEVEPFFVLIVGLDGPSGCTRNTPNSEIRSSGCRCWTILWTHFQNWELLWEILGTHQSPLPRHKHSRYLQRTAYINFNVKFCCCIPIHLIIIRPWKPIPSRLISSNILHWILSEEHLIKSNGTELAFIVQIKFCWIWEKLHRFTPQSHCGKPLAVLVVFDKSSDDNNFYETLLQPGIATSEHRFNYE